jgi:hypothetical protein
LVAVGVAFADVVGERDTHRIADRPHQQVNGDRGTAVANRAWRAARLTQRRADHAHQLGDGHAAVAVAVADARGGGERRRPQLGAVGELAGGEERQIARADDCRYGEIPELGHRPRPDFGPVALPEAAAIGSAGAETQRPGTSAQRARVRTVGAGVDVAQQACPRQRAIARPDLLAVFSIACDEEDPARGRGKPVGKVLVKPT